MEVTTLHVSSCRCCISVRYLCYLPTRLDHRWRRSFTAPHYASEESQGYWFSVSHAPAAQLRCGLPAQGAARTTSTGASFTGPFRHGVYQQPLRSAMKHADRLRWFNGYRVILTLPSHSIPWLLCEAIRLRHSRADDTSPHTSTSLPYSVRVSARREVFSTPILSVTTQHHRPS